jgi:Rod binding domain-containing protein
VLLRQILNDARKPVFKSSLTEKSATSAIYDEMVTAQLADAVSRSGEFGLARSLTTQLQPIENNSEAVSPRTIDSPSS